MPAVPPTHPAPQNVRRRSVLSALALGAATAGLSGCAVVSDGVVPAGQEGLRLAKEPAPGRERTIEMYNIWGGLAGNAWVSLAELYEESQPHTAVKITYAPISAETQVRLLTAIAADTPPDVALVTPEQYPQFAGLGVMTPLDDQMAAAGLTGQDYVPAIWDQMTIEGPVYSLPGMVDPNFPLFWNKTLFAEVGLDPEVPPETIDDLDRMADAMLVREGSRVTRIGTIPWDYYGFSNSMFTVGFAFGGRFVSDDNEVATPDHPNVVTGLQWMCDFAQRIGGAGSIAVASPAQTLPVLAGGRVGMMPMTTLDSGNVYTNAPDVDLGAALFPYAEGLGSRGSASWLGGWNLFVPKGCQYPDSAWDFIRFCTATSEGTVANYDAQKAVPGIVTSPALAELEADPLTAIFHEVLMTVQNVRPATPVSGVLAQQLDINVGRAVFGQLTPEQALKTVADVVNAEWDTFRKEHP